MRGRRSLVLACVASSLLSALAAVVINVATGGTITAHAAWLWALIAVLVLGTAAVGCGSSFCRSQRLRQRCRTRSRLLSCPPGYPPCKDVTRT